LGAEVGLYAQLVHLMYQDYGVVRYQLTQQFIFLSKKILRLQLIPKFRFYHVESAFNIASLVIVFQETVPAGIVKQFNLKEGDMLEWKIKAESKDKLIVIVKPVSKGKN